MISRFELFVAGRYLRARRKEAVISVITAISVAGVAVGVMALVIATAVTNGFSASLEHSLLGAMAHIDVLERQPGYGIENWREMAVRIRKVPHVLAVSPALYEPAPVMGGSETKEAYLKGIEVGPETAVSDVLRHLKSGSLDRLRDASANPPGIILGARLAEDSGMMVPSNLSVVAQELTPLGPHAAIRRFRVCGTFETGFFDIDDHWAYVSLPELQKAFGLEDVVNHLEIKVDDLNRAPEIARDVEAAAGPHYTTTTWMEQNKPLLSALSTERLLAIIVIGLIELVAALNILTTLVMLVMEKYRDIAVLMSMGAKRAQIRRIFMLQGVLIGAAGSAIGLALAYPLCALAAKYHWLPLDETIYALSSVPFDAHWTDGVWIAATAIAVSFLATIYPARSATRIAPAEVLRYE